LRVKFQERPFHVFHYIGHGGVHDDSEEGVLYFHGPDERPQPVTGRALATTLKPFRDNLDLVFLNGCHTARDGGATRHDPFTGVATALILGGVPAVLAMQFPITDEAAIEFSDELYRRLAAGEALEAAVTEGRQKVHAEHPESMEWGTPVLFMRTPIDVSTGRGFTLARVSKAGALWLGASLLALAIGGFILFPANGARRDCRFSSLELDLANVGSRRWFEGDDIRLKAEELALNSLMGRVKFAGEDGLEECSCRWFALPRREVTSTGEPCGFSISPSPKETFDLRLLVDGRYSRIFTIRVENSKHLQIPGNRPTMPTVGYLQVATVRKRDGTSTDLSEGDVIEVIPEKALLYTRPSIDSDTRTLLGSGATARILKQVDDWIEVELYDSIEKGNQNEKTEGR
jgi:molybdopterin converting factor small subunit